MTITIHRNRLAAVAEDPRRQGAEHLMRTRDNGILANGRPEPTAIVLECFFRHARDHVKILCGNLDKRVFNDEALCQALRAAVADKISVQILILEPVDGAEDASNRFWGVIQDLHAYPNLAVIPNAKACGALPSLANFALMDARAVRYERDPSMAPKTAISAIASMNQPEFAGLLCGNFDRIWSDVESLALVA